MELFIAINSGIINEVIRLINYGVDVNIKNKLGSTPLHYSNSKEITELLINSGADVNARNDWGNTPLHCSNGNPVITELLIKAGADVNARNEYGSTPLHYYFLKENAEFLIKAGADINAQNKWGDTPLHYFVDIFSEYNMANNYHYKEMIELLLCAGVNINIRNEDGYIPFDYISKEQTNYFIELQKPLWSPERHWIVTIKNKEFINTIMCLNSRNTGLWSTLPLELVYIFFEVSI